VAFTIAAHLPTLPNVVEQQEGVALELLGATADDPPIGVPIEAAH